MTRDLELKADAVVDEVFETPLIEQRGCVQVPVVPAVREVLCKFPGVKFNEVCVTVDMRLSLYELRATISRAAVITFDGLRLFLAKEIKGDSSNDQATAWRRITSNT
ncbi:hypothetical protein L915_20766 [Phytophthora nicotianae]|uniref:Uncharacterized protein n=1 Tax=Phytophthora nicotianae TaxID=4792 RepID=W2FN18_PHYNI|nr:hypothetical protein L915_20766 [Phytophthora nicotianae]ETL25502.1 hypothetical protein L916_20651 [Phytophthora nicotianae]